jgi:hypothetical protein
LVDGETVEILSAVTVEENGASKKVLERSRYERLITWKEVDTHYEDGRLVTLVGFGHRRPDPSSQGIHSPESR